MNETLMAFFSDAPLFRLARALAAYNYHSTFLLFLQILTSTTESNRSDWLISK